MYTAQGVKSTEYPTVLPLPFRAVNILQHEHIHGIHLPRMSTMHGRRAHRNHVGQQNTARRLLMPGTRFLRIRAASAVGQ